MSQLSDLYKGLGLIPGAGNTMAPFPTTANSTVPIFPTTRNLPNGGGTFTGATVVPPAAPQTPAPVQPAQTPAPTGPTIHADYLGDNGALLSPAEVVAKQAAKLSGGSAGDVPQFAGNQFTQGPQTTVQTQATATQLNNSRNDIATGATDPYGAASKSGIAYTADELKAIEKAYGGVYDPAITTALAKLDLKQKQDAAEVTAKQRIADQIFQTNENIRQWKATTGLGTTDGGTKFTTTQENKGASNAGMDPATFKALNSTIKNFFVNPPMGKNAEGKSVPVRDIFRAALQDVKDGKDSAENVAQEITDSNLPQEVKTYYLDQMPLDSEIKQGFLARVWSAITGN